MACHLQRQWVLPEPAHFDPKTLHNLRTINALCIRFVQTITSFCIEHPEFGPLTQWINIIRSLGGTRIADSISLA